MNVAKLKEKIRRSATRVAQKFRKGDHEKGFIGAGVGAILIAIGSTGYLGNTVSSMIHSLTNSTTTGTSGASGIASFVNDVIVLIGIISVIVGIIEYRRLRSKILDK
jgi:hypothetical protein